jgi:hypothetical protein
LISASRDRRAAERVVKRYEATDQADKAAQWKEVADFEKVKTKQ